MSIRNRLAAVAAALAVAAVVTPAALAGPPVFVDGQAQIAFSTNSATWIRGEAWVESDVDSDFDGKLDRVHIDITRVQETETEDLKVPVIMEVSPYYAGNSPVVNWAVDHELGFPPETRPVRTPSIRATSPKISTAHESTWVPRGFAVVHVEGMGSGHTEGCPTSGAPNETAAPRAVVDWLNGRAKAYTTRTSDVEVTAPWTTGRVGMIGTSYNGTLPIAVATTGVQGLEAIVPISAISSWYDYYRANGAVRAPGGFQGEDLDVLAEYVYTRADQTICRPVIADLVARQDRVTGDSSPFWASRDYMLDVDKIRAATMVAHGNNDWNVMTKHAAQLYAALRARGVPHQLYWHQGGHGGSPPTVMLNRWFTRYLWNVENGVEEQPKAWVVREGQSSQSPTPYAEWPDPATGDATLRFSGGAPGIGGLTFAPVGPATETIVDNAGITVTTLMNSLSSTNRLVFKSPVLAAPIRISGTPTIDLRVAFSKPKANLTAILVNYPGGTGNGTIVSRGWIDPENRTRPDLTEAVTPGTSYRLRFDLQPKDSVIAAGRRLGIVILSSDREHSIRPAAGTQLTVDLLNSTVTLPVVGGAKALGEAVGVTAPAIAHTLSPAEPDGDAGWYRGDVALAWQLANTGAALTLTGCVDETFAVDGIFTRSCAAENVVGSAGPVSVTVKRDATAPAVAVTGVEDGAVYLLGEAPQAGCTTSDATSGVAAAATLTESGGPVGTFTATCSGARDVAGNSGSASATYRVVYRFGGFGPPATAGVTTWTAGAALPVRFTLGGDQGLGILAAGSPVFQRTSCATGAPIGAATAADGLGGLSYDADSGFYVWVWRTPRNAAGSCGRLELRLVDGSTHPLSVRFA